MIASVSSVAADDLDLPKIVDRNVYDCDIIETKSSSYVVVNLNEKITFTAYTSKINKVDWNFGDKSKVIKTKTKNQTSIATHTFKKVGTYKVNVFIDGKSGNIQLQNTEEFITVKVVKKPDLIFTKLNYAPKGKNIVGFSATVKNKGNVASKACYLKMWYENPKLKKYNKLVKISALKPGKSTSVIVAFKIPYKYRKQIKYVKVDSSNKIAESIKSNNQIRLNDVISIK